jgi:hypothetical protein
LPARAAVLIDVGADIGADIARRTRDGLLDGPAVRPRPDRGPPGERAVRVAMVSFGSRIRASCHVRPVTRDDAVCGARCAAC